MGDTSMFNVEDTMQLIDSMIYILSSQIIAYLSNRQADSPDPLAK